MCQAAIIVEKRRLISLVLPWTRKMMGAGLSAKADQSGCESVRVRFKREGRRRRGERHDNGLEVRGRSFDVGDEEATAGLAGKVADKRDVNTIAPHRRLSRKSMLPCGSSVPLPMRLNALPVNLMGSNVVQPLAMVKLTSAESKAVLPDARSYLRMRRSSWEPS